MRRAISYNSFFVYSPKRPLISSYSKFIYYYNNNGILVTKYVKKQAMVIYLDSVKPCVF
jgi:hypothetical protein